MKSPLFVIGAVAVGVGLGDPATPGASSLTRSPGAPVGGHAVFQEYCVRCHGDNVQQAGLSLLEFDVADAGQKPEVAEKIIRKLRAGMMPPPGERRPDADTLTVLVTEIETQVDRTAADAPNPGGRTFQRLNRAEYQSSIRDLLDLEVDAGDYLPLDAKSANFDNIADAQMLSATLLDAYLTAAAEISRLAIGDAHAVPASRTYTNPGYVTQWDRVDGAPRGTRGGVSVIHNFVADGQYIFKMAFEHTTTGGFFGQTTKGEQIEISIDGQRAALLEVDRWMHVSDPNGVNMQTDPIAVRAGPHRVSAVFLRQSEGPVEDLLSRHEWSLVDRQIGVSGYGITAVAHLKDLVVEGPHNPTGVSETPSRRKIFTRRPTTAEEERPAAQQILAELATRAYRRSIRAEELKALMSFFHSGAAESGFEMGIRRALQAILASPDFLFRFEEPVTPPIPGQSYRINDIGLASRMSFFLWGAPPDEELRAMAAASRLADRTVRDQQVRRMLEDPRSDALATRFAAQWLRLEDLDKVHPDFLQYPDFHQQLADAMRRETELFFDHLVRRDRSVLELLTADYTFVNERLARHYRIPGVNGEGFRRVELQDDHRRGLLGHGSILTLTSHANRTSPVLRGKWVMEVFLGSPPPPPPPNVPEFDETAAVGDGRLLSVRERLEMHRANPACNSCHRMMDPIGVALENFDVTGAWRIRDNGTPIDAVTELYDGTPMNGPTDLRNALLGHRQAFIRNFIENLMAYALGRRLEYYDMPTVRTIARDAAANGDRMSAIILGIVNSPAFRMTRVEDPGDERK